MSLRPELCSSIALPLGAVPDWLHLLPAGEIMTRDGRGPYRVKDPTALIAASSALGKLPLDENHATDLLAPKGGAAPARGWIVELQQRGDGIWGRVEWTGAGRKIMQDREYRGVSPVIAHNGVGNVSAILRASLTNTPNFTGLVALHSALHPVAVRTKAIMQKARALQAEFERRGLPIDLASAIESVSEEDDASQSSAPLDGADLAVISRLGVDKEAYLRTKNPAAPDPSLSPADLHVIARLGIDPAAYLRDKA